MPRRDDISTILILGSGPIVIGQACEFDYSGTQACKALREDGYRIVLVNSNPATIMTDPEFSDRTYIEPITLEAVTKIIAKEKANGTPIDALLPTLGGQIALNTACALYDDGTLAKFGIEMIGATREAIDRAENREKFIAVIKSIGLRLPRALTVTNLDEAWRFLDEIGLPVILRPAFTMGGAGGGIAYNRDEFEDLVRRGMLVHLAVEDRLQPRGELEHEPEFALMGCRAGGHQHGSQGGDRCYSLHRSSISCCENVRRERVHRIDFNAERYSSGP
ncbi:MAG: hypothetical protein IIA64_03840 [Planctomycetes bacterium]|nr:hypothetical protein [Planctomycetota bacterium]